jgi:hypothetical protein
MPEFYSIKIKGTTLPNRSIVACLSLINKKYDEENAILAGTPARLVKRNITREEFYIFETHPLNNIVEYLNL